jgi:hypothetical protein
MGVESGAVARGRSFASRRGFPWRAILGSAIGIALGAAVTIVPPVLAAGDPFIEDRSGASIDWRRGIIEATGGAAADHRMPSADVARPGAERRARAVARARITELLRELPLGGGRRLDEAAVSRAVGRARPTNVEYQSNGGALVRLEVAFGDWGPSPTSPVDGRGHDAGAKNRDASSSASPEPEPVAFLLAEGHLAAAPLVVVRGREIALGHARYMAASAVPAGAAVLTVHADKKGRLLLDDDKSLPELAGRPAVVYVQKILR